MRIQDDPRWKQLILVNVYKSIKSARQKGNSSIEQMMKAKRVCKHGTVTIP